ncbi:hypothetical protein BKA93DRAFT_418735 [Sparassis latifolia]
MFMSDGSRRKFSPLSGQTRQPHVAGQPESRVQRRFRRNVKMLQYQQSTDTPKSITLEVGWAILFKFKFHAPTMTLPYQAGFSDIQACPDTPPKYNFGFPCTSVSPTMLRKGRRTPALLHFSKICRRDLKCGGIGRRLGEFELVEFADVGAFATGSLSEGRVTGSTEGARGIGETGGRMGDPACIETAAVTASATVGGVFAPPDNPLNVEGGVEL